MSEKKLQDHIDDNLFVSLLNLHLKEFTHRDNILWSQAKIFFYGITIMALVPLLGNQFSDKFFSCFQICICFPVAGLFGTIIFSFIVNEYSLRLKSTTKTYNKLMGMIKENDFSRVRLDCVRSCPTNCSDLTKCEKNINSCNVYGGSIEGIFYRCLNKPNAIFGRFREHIGETAFLVMILALIFICCMSMIVITIKFDREFTLLVFGNKFGKECAIVYQIIGSIICFIICCMGINWKKLK